MLKKLFILIAILTLNINNVLAGEILLKISPVETFTTCKENVFEGDTVKFKVVEENGNIKKDEILTGTILKYKPNGFNGEQANIEIGNFRKENGSKIYGSLYLSGNMHQTYQEYVNGLSSNFLAMPLIRGGEIKINPNTILTLVVEEKIKKDEVIPLKIKPEELITTCHDETQTNDIIRFRVVNDIYNNNKLYIKKDTRIIGYVDYVHENGWDYDNAQIDIKKFKTRDANNNIIEINSELSINGFETLKYKSNRPAQFFNYIGVVFRGKEIEIIPEKDKNVIFNIWLIK